MTQLGWPAASSFCAEIHTINPLMLGLLAQEWLPMVKLRALAVAPQTL